MQLMVWTWLCIFLVELINLLGAFELLRPFEIDSAMHLNWLEKFNGRSNLNRSTRQNSELADMVKLDKTDK